MDSEILKYVDRHYRRHGKEVKVNSFIESLKDGLRTVVLAIIPIVLMGVNIQTRTFHVDWFLVELTAIVAGLTFIDSLLHRTGTADKGLTRF